MDYGDRADDLFRSLVHLVSRPFKLLKPETQGWGNNTTSTITTAFARLVQRRGRLILIVFFALLVLSVWGMSFL
tara:strand:- start:1379 stop:1600 length:222 start_codon:yes stop_codon:yes gene_type:complete